MSRTLNCTKKKGKNMKENRFRCTVFGMKAVIECKDSNILYRISNMMHNDI